MSINVLGFEKISSARPVDSSEIIDIYRIKIQRADGELCDADVKLVKNKSGYPSQLWQRGELESLIGPALCSLVVAELRSFVRGQVVRFPFVVELAED